MLKLQFTRESHRLPALSLLHQYLMEEMRLANGNIQKLADQMLIRSRELTASGALDDSLLQIKLFKVRSTEWNVLLIKYRKYPHCYHCELVKVKDQISIFA